MIGLLQSIISETSLFAVSLLSYFSSSSSSPQTALKAYTIPTVWYLLSTLSTRCHVDASSAQRHLQQGVSRLVLLQHVRSCSLLKWRSVDKEVAELRRWTLFYKNICGLQLPMEPHRSTRLLQLTGRWQYDGIMWLALRSIKSNNVDFLNQIRYFRNQVVTQLSLRG